MPAVDLGLEVPGRAPGVDGLLPRLLGCRLSSVAFVLDYVQLHFDRVGMDDEPILTCDVLPAVETASGVVRPGEPGHADALIALMPGDVLEVREAPGDGFRIQLTTGVIVMRPEPDDLVGPEIARLHGFADREWACWRPGSASFEYL